MWDTNANSYILSLSIAKPPTLLLVIYCLLLWLLWHGLKVHIFMIIYVTYTTTVTVDVADVVSFRIVLSVTATTSTKRFVPIRKRASNTIRCSKVERTGLLELTRNVNFDRCRIATSAIVDQIDPLRIAKDAKAQRKIERVKIEKVSVKGTLNGLQQIFRE